MKTTELENFKKHVALVGERTRALAFVELTHDGQIIFLDSGDFVTIAGLLSILQGGLNSRMKFDHKPSEKAPPAQAPMAQAPMAENAPFATPEPSGVVIDPMVKAKLNALKAH